MEKKEIDHKKQGKKNRLAGAVFERKVRADLIDKGWNVDKFTNNIFEGEVKAAKTNRWMMRSMGFPDFIAWGKWGIIGVECKCNGRLSKDEKEKCKIYLDKKVFHRIWIASKDGTKIKYTRFT